MEPLRLPILLFLSVLLLPLAKPDLGSDRAALLALRSAVGGRTLLWNVTFQSPCFWPGVICENNRVAVLRLPGVALSGALPNGIFGNLTALRTLSLRLNALTGSLPSDLASCTNLRNLYLQGNFFFGEIPDFLFTLHDLVRLNLASNNFSGEIPASFNNLTRLRTLFIEENRLSGSIPELKLPNLDQFNVSNNLLNGSIPAKLQTFKSASFLGNELCGGPLGPCPGDNATLPSGEVDINGKANKRKLSGGVVAGIVIGCVVAALVILVLLIFFCRKKSRKTRSVDVASLKHSESEIPREKPAAAEAENGGYNNGNGYSVAAAAAAAMTAGNGKSEANNNNNTAGVKKLVFFGNAARVFDLEDLLRASAEVLGKGTFGTAYKAVLEAGIVVAVKRLKDVTISDKEFREKIETVGAMDHGNLVPLRAYYYSRDEKLLVYDYMPMGSLSALLHGQCLSYITICSFISFLIHCSAFQFYNYHFTCMHFDIDDDISDFFSFHPLFLLDDDNLDLFLLVSISSFSPSLYLYSYHEKLNLG